MKKIISFITCLILLCVFFSCEKGQILGNGYLDKTPDQNLSIKDIFAKRQYTQNYLTDIYSGLPMKIDQGTPLAPWTGISDEMEITFGEFVGHRINHGGLAPSNVPRNWIHDYQQVRKTNIFLEHIDQLPLSDNYKQATKDSWIGEATFLRAYFHFLTFRLYGAIPIMNKTVETDADFSKIKRAPLDSVVAFMIRDCDRAAQLLPATRSTDKKGRINKLAALALKAHILLYAASPLFNGNPNYANFTDKDGLHLFPQSYDKQKWKSAALAAKDLIDEAESAGHELYRSGSDDPVKSYQGLFLNNWNKEVLWATNRGRFQTAERVQNPLGYGGFSIMSVSQQLVDAYQMSNGENPISGYKTDGEPIINPSSGYQEQGYTNTQGKYWDAGIRNMYVNREPRFYASVHFSGTEWKGRQVEMWYSGLDGHSKNESDYSETGYVMKKFSDPNINIPQGTGWTLKTRNIYRLGRAYLNYAEALNEWKGPESNVYKYVNAVRDRAGLPPLANGLSQDQMRQKIHHERRIELAFEGARYFDTHRWKIAESTQNGPLYGMSVNNGNSLQDDSFYKRVAIDKRTFVNPRDYLWPIPTGEVDNDKSLIQNPGW